MEIRFSVVSDKQEWDSYVATHPSATPYHRFAWVQSVEAAYKHKNVSLLAIENNKVVGILPCVHMKKPFSSTQVCALPYCDLGFCLADSPKIQSALMAKALEHLNSLQGNAFDYRDTGATAENEQDLDNKKVRMLLPLPESSEILLAAFKSKLRSQIRKSEKNGLTFRMGTEQELIEDFYQIFAINMRKLGSPVHSKNWFETLFKNYQEHIVLSVVYTEDTPIGAGIVLLNGDKASIPWASTVSEYNKLAPNMMLYWSLLQHVCDRGTKEFDFGRSTYNEGTYKFKRQWGAQPVPLKWSTYLCNGKQIIDSNTSGKNSKRELVEKIWTHLPLPITTFLGPKIRKYISL